MSFKKLKRDQTAWYQPSSGPPIAIFRCRQCLEPLTRPLALLTDALDLGGKEGRSRVPEGRYWRVAEGQEFAGQFAVPTSEVLGLPYHSDRRRLEGCCGPCGSNGPNRLCPCGREVGTEQSDCIYPHAVYLDPSRVRMTVPEA